MTEPVDFRRRLDRYTAARPPPQHVSSVLEELRSRIADVAIRHALSRPAEPREPVGLPGTRAGELRRIVEYMSPDHHHGKVPIASALRADSSAIAMLALDPSLAGLDLSRAVYLDTETTGLSGGTGTIPFLVGLAWFEDESLCVEQLFLESPGEEGPVLEALRARLEDASCVISYNGKAFDWPLLVARAVMARVPPPPVRPHIDLLHIARRCFRRRLGSVRLVEVEAAVLGMYRERDIDGAEIPGLYWSYLRHRDGAALLPVLEHNVNDLVALAALLGFVASRAQKLHATDEPEDHLAIAEVAVRHKTFDRAFEFARAAFEGGAGRSLTVRAGLLLADLLLRRAEPKEAVAALDECLAAAGSDGVLAAPVHLALAKIWEHKLKDPVRALIHARGTVPEEKIPDAARRLARLQKRVAKLAPGGSAPAAQQHREHERRE